MGTAIWDAGCGASVRGPFSTREMVQGLPAASDRVHLARSYRDSALPERTTDMIRVAARLRKRTTSALKTVRGVPVCGIASAHCGGTVIGDVYRLWRGQMPVT